MSQLRDEGDVVVPDCYNAHKESSFLPAGLSRGFCFASAGWAGGGPFGHFGTTPSSSGSFLAGSTGLFLSRPILHVFPGTALSYLFRDSAFLVAVLAFSFF